MRNYFYPTARFDNPERCDKAGVPKTAIVKMTKIELAIELIDEAIKAGVEFGWINAVVYMEIVMSFVNT